MSELGGNHQISVKCVATKYDAMPSWVFALRMGRPEPRHPTWARISWRYKRYRAGATTGVPADPERLNSIFTDGLLTRWVRPRRRAAVGPPGGGSATGDGSV